MAVMKMKRTTTTNKVHASIKSLPNDLLAEVFARVASHSIADLFNVELSCKEFLEVGNDVYVLQHACMNGFPVAPWPISREAYSFLKRCRESGNAEALFKQGMYEYFTLSEKESGLELLKRATQKGHAEATYVLGVLILCCCGDKRRQALKILSSLKNSTKSRCFKVGECRKRVKQIVSTLWVHKNNINILHGVEENDHNSNTRTCNCWNTWSKSGWEETDNGDTCSESCFWDREVALFYNFIRTSLCLHDN